MAVSRLIKGPQGGQRYRADFGEVARLIALPIAGILPCSVRVKAGTFQNIQQLSIFFQPVDILLPMALARQGV